MDDHETILAETSDILKLSFDRIQQAQKETTGKEAIPPRHREAVQRLALDLQEERQHSTELEATVNQLSEQLSDFETENEDLKRRLEQMTGELESVCVSNSELERELFKRQRAVAQTEELESSLKEKDTAIKEWHEHLAELEDKFSKLEQENQHLREELQRTASLHEERLSDSPELAQIRRLPDDQTVDKLKHDLSNLQELRSRLTETNRKLTAELLQKRAEIAELAQENMRLRTEAQAAVLRRESLEDAVTELKKERSVLAETVENLQEVTQRQSRDLLGAARRGDSDQQLLEVTTRLNEEMRRRLSDKAAIRTILQRDKEAFTAKLAEKDALIASLRERQSSWTPEIAYRTSQQLASLSTQLLQEREKRFAAERSLSVSSRQELRREMYESKVSVL